MICISGYCRRRTSSYDRGHKEEKEEEAKGQCDRGIWGTNQIKRRELCLVWKKTLTSESNFMSS